MDKYIFNSQNGIVSIDTSTLKEETQEEYKNALGENLSLEDATPQGRLIDIDVTMKKNILENNKNIINSFNINLAFGNLLDNIAANFNFNRQPSTQSKVKLTLTGVPNTIIPAESKVSDEDGNVYYLEEEAIIGDNGEIEAMFLSVEYGTVVSVINTIKQIIDGVVGWETVNNNYNFEYIGNKIESDASFRRKIKNGALYNGKGLLYDYKSAILRVENVEKCFVRDNYEKIDIIYKGVTIGANSIYCCVYGGNDEEVAKAILNCKSNGCGYTGNIVIQVTDDNFGGFYNVKFQRPTLIDIYINITIKIINNSSSNIEEEIKQVLIDYSKGNLDNFGEIGIGDNVNCFDLSSVIGGNIQGIVINNIEISTDGEIFSNNDIIINVDELANFIKEKINIIIV